MRISASSGLAGMSLGGTTLDWLMGFRYCSNSTVDIETLKSRFEGIELLIIDEISMIGCRKLLKVDSLLKRVFNDTRPFGGLHVLLVGDFAQLPAIRQIPIIDTMVKSTKCYIDHSDLEIQIEALFGLFKKYELRGFRRSKDCKKLKNLLKKFRDYENTGPTLLENDLKRIGILNKKVLRKDPEFRNASILVTTKKERDAINKRSGCEWARKNGVPVYWWFQRPTRDVGDTIEADHYAYSMSKFCCGIRAFYIPGANCMLKANPFPTAGYANGSQGRMVGIVHDDSDYVLPLGSPGEMIMIPPPKFIIMEVDHKGKEKRTSIFPCKRERTVLEYKREKKDCIYSCWSNMVVLTFALTIHECQGQTLSRIILLLGRLPGMNVGKITWSLLYVALSRTKKLSHIKLFPTGSTKYYHSMYFSHLLRLSMPANLKKWNRSYIEHCWDRNVLRNEHLQSVRKVEQKLMQLGEEKTKKLYWDELTSFVKQMGYKATTRDRKPVLFCKLREHMVKRLLWKTSKNYKPAMRKGDRRSKRKGQEMEAESSGKAKLSLHRSKRLRKSTKSKVDHKQHRRSNRNRSSRKRRSGLVDLTSSAMTFNENRGNKKKRKFLGRTKVLASNISNRKHEIVDPKVSNGLSNSGCQNPHTVIWKGLWNLGNSCYFNSVVQCLYHCPIFRTAIQTVTPEALRVAVVNQLQMLFVEMAGTSSFPYITPIQCLTAAMNIPECKRAGMIVNGPQQDASEFLVHLLTHFEEKIKSLSDIFEGELVSTRTCQRCFHSCTSNQPFKLYSLQMDLPSMNEIQPLDLYNLMHHFHRTENLYDYRCEHCNSYNSKKKLSIITLPRILVIHLSRFRGLQKIHEYVRFNTQVSIKYNTDGSEYHKQYRIMGIVVHLGSSIASGHYIAYIRAGEKWFKMNDDTVSAVCWRTVRRKKAYLLFFEQI